MAAYYNENDPAIAAWLRELIAAGLIAPGDGDGQARENAGRERIWFSPHCLSTRLFR